MASLWTIHLFGTLRATQGDQTLTRFRTHKTGALLAYLAFYHHRSHPRELLIDLFWPDDALESGRHSLRLALSSLRHQLETPGSAAGTVLLADRNTVQLNPEAVTTDVAQFEAALQAAAQAQSPLETVRWLSAAMELYRGPLLSGSYESWVLPQQLRLEDEYVQAVLRLVEVQRAGGQLQQALQTAVRAVGADPLREELHLGLMGVLVAAGQVGAAQQQYARFERLCLERLGEGPSVAAREFAQHLQRRQKAPSLSGASALPTSAAPVVPSGSSRSRPPLATGTLTFLLLDLPAEAQSQASPPAGAALWQRLRETIQQAGGYELRSAEGSLAVAFGRARDALVCALACRRALRSQEAGTEEAVPLRMALHTGEVHSRKESASRAQKRSTEQNGPLALATEILLCGHGGQVLCSEATATLLRQASETGLQLKPLGAYRLRQASAPERLFQLLHPDLPAAEFPAVNAPAGFSGSLPLQMTRFIGRQQELDRLQSLLQVNSASRLIVLTGVGGSGKTRLALELAKRLADPLQGAVWFVPLADTNEANLIIGSILQALGLSSQPGTDPWEQVVDALSRQPSVLILDNFEQLLASSLPSNGATIVRSLLERVPTLTALVTSRFLLGIPGEQEFAVPPLPIPQKEAGLEQLRDVESIALFVDRARSVRPDFQLTSANVPAVSELCRRLEGIPLALELAAARAQVMSPAQILGRLADRLDFFVSRRREGVARHRSLRAALDWSYQLLRPEQQRIFARLSVFRGGWTADAAEQVIGEREQGIGEKQEGVAGESGATQAQKSIFPETCNLSPVTSHEVLDYLLELRECSLIFTEDRGEETRFRMLETVREYGAERLQETREETHSRDRHLQFFLRLAEETEPRLTPEEQGPWLERLESEHENLRAALSWCRQQKENAETGLRLAAALCWFWEIHGYFSEGREHLQAALSQKITPTQALIRARALYGAGNLARNQADYAAAGTLYEESLALCRARGDRPGMAAALNGLGDVSDFQGDRATAQALYEESLTIFREIDDRWGIATTLDRLASAAKERGDYAGARALYEESLILSRERRDPRGMATSLLGLGSVAWYQGDFPAARSFYEESLTLHKQLGDRRGISKLLIGLGEAAHCQGDYIAAHAWYQESLALRRQLGDKTGIAYSLNDLGCLAQDQGDYTAAQTLYEECLALSREIGNRQAIAFALHNLGTVVYKLGNYERARALHEESLTLGKELSDKKVIAVSFNGLGNIARQQGDYAQAFALGAKNLALMSELGDKNGIAASLEALADLSAERGQMERAVQIWAAAESLREAISSPMPADEKANYDRLVSAARFAMDQKAFTAATSQGQTMTLEQAIRYALDEAPPTR